MSIKERRKNEKAEMRKKIMNAAIQIINQDGYENLSIRKIATKIEYSPTTIYIYYKDKAQIVSDMANELYIKIESNVISALDEYALLSVDKQVREIMSIFIKSLSSESEMTKAIMYGGVNVIFASEDIGKIPTNTGIRIFDKLIDDGINQKKFKQHLNNTSWMLVNALLGFVMCAIENQLYCLENFDQLVGNFIDILMGGIYNDCPEKKL